VNAITDLLIEAEGLDPLCRSRLLLSSPAMTVGSGVQGSLVSV
jgi:hypothetical protein